MSNDKPRFSLDSRVKVSEPYVSLSAGRIPSVPGVILNETYIGQILSVGVKFDTGEFRWLPQSILDSV